MLNINWVPLISLLVEKALYHGVEQAYLITKCSQKCALVNIILVGANMTQHDTPPDEQGN